MQDMSLLLSDDLLLILVLCAAMCGAIAFGPSVRFPNIFKRKTYSKGLNVPIATSRIPWFGLALQFQSDAHTLLRHLSSIHGPIFKIKLTGKSQVFVTSKSLAVTIMRDPSVSGQILPTRVLADACKINDMGHCRKVLYSVIFPHLDREFSKARLEQTAGFFASSLLKRLQTAVPVSNDYTEMYLSDLIRPHIYAASSDVILGSAFPADDTFEDFWTFDLMSPLLASPFSPLMWTAKKARERLVKTLLAFNAQATSTGSGVTPLHAESGRLLQENGFDPESSARITLAFMLAVQGNTLRVSFWTLAFLLQNREDYKSLTETIDRVIANDFHGDISAITPDSILNRDIPLLDSIIHETLRLVTVIPCVRTAEHDYLLATANAPTYRIEKGENVMISPSVIHFDESKYPDPHQFKMRRFIDPDTQEIQLDESGQPITKDLISWGGGRHMCKGRLLALHEAKVIFMIYLHLFDIEAVGVGPKGSITPGYRVPRQDHTTFIMANAKDDMLLRIRRRQPSN